jgi:hypothetical protein
MAATQDLLRRSSAEAFFASLTRHTVHVRHPAVKRAAALVELGARRRPDD